MLAFSTIFWNVIVPTAAGIILFYAIRKIDQISYPPSRRR